MKIVAAILGVFTFCCINVWLLETITRKAPGAGVIITFAQFLVIALEGFLHHLSIYPSVVPIKHYFIIVIVFFSVNVANNAAFDFNISMPLHMIFKSGSLIANMVLSIWILKRSYNWNKYLSVAMITFGVFICTYMSASSMQKKVSTPGSQTGEQIPESKAIVNFLIGIGLLTFSLLASARLGIFQETLYAKFGKHPREALYFTHLLALPAFLIFYRDIMEHVAIFNASGLIYLPDFLSYLPSPLVPAMAIPELWFYLVLNALTQYGCIRSVYFLTSECTSLTVTLVVTLRKFLSLIFSVYYFKNEFNNAQWFGAALVFAGTLLFVDLHTYINHWTSFLLPPKGPKYKLLNNPYGKIANGQ